MSTNKRFIPNILDQTKPIFVRHRFLKEDDPRLAMLPPTKPFRKWPGKLLDEAVRCGNQIGMRNAEHATGIPAHTIRVHRRMMEKAGVMEEKPRYVSPNLRIGKRKYSLELLAKALEEICLLLEAEKRLDPHYPPATAIREIADKHGISFNYLRSLFYQGILPQERHIARALKEASKLRQEPEPSEIGSVPLPQTESQT